MYHHLDPHPQPFSPRKNAPGEGRNLQQRQRGSNMLRRILLGFMLLAIQSLVFANSSYDSLNQLLKSIQNMKANFSQTIVDQKGSEIQKSYGKMALQRPGKFRWQTISPNAQLVIATNTRLWIYDPDLEQVVIRSLSGQTGQTPALLLSDANPVLDSDFQVKQEKTTSDLQWYVLTPKDRGSMFTSIRMGFSGNELHNMQLRDHLDHTTTIVFTHIQLNASLPASLFKFTPPKHVDIIDETKNIR